VFLVALVGLATPVEQEAPALAVDLGLTAYEVGLLLRAAMPSILLRTDDRARATDLLGKLRGRGHDAVAFDGSAVVASEQMHHPRSFRLEGDALVSVGPLEEQRLPFADLLVIARAVHQTRTDSVTTTTEKKISIGRTALSGGLMTTKSVTKESSRSTEEREPVAYLFRRSGETPWLLASTRLRYDALGPRIRPSQHENFDVLLERLKELAPAATYDRRLTAVRSVAEKLRSEGKGDLRATSSSGVDVLAHVVAMAIARHAT
jgi:hypothetical protein